MKSKLIVQATIIFLIVIVTAPFTNCNRSNHEKSSKQTSQTTGLKNDSLAFGDLNWVSDGFRGKVYLLPEDTKALPDFDSMKPVNTLYTKTINIPTRDWETGFPGLPDRVEWFAVVYQGNFKVKEAGHYSFRLLSDDGSKLYIDQQLVINNDGVHSSLSKTGEMDLDNSQHSITIQYFQGPRNEIALQLFAARNHADEQIFPGNSFTLFTPRQNSLVRDTFLISLVIIVILVIWFISYRWWRKNILVNKKKKNWY